MLFPSQIANFYFLGPPFFPRRLLNSVFDQLPMSPFNDSVFGFFFDRFKLSSAFGLVLDFPNAFSSDPKMSSALAEVPSHIKDHPAISLTILVRARLKSSASGNRLLDLHCPSPRHILWNPSIFLFFSILSWRLDGHFSSSGPSWDLATEHSLPFFHLSFLFCKAPPLAPRFPFRHKQHPLTRRNPAFLEDI